MELFLLLNVLPEQLALRFYFSLTKHFLPVFPTRFFKISTALRSFQVCLLRLEVFYRFWIIKNIKQKSFVFSLLVYLFIYFSNVHIRYCWKQLTLTFIFIKIFPLVIWLFLLLLWLAKSFTSCHIHWEILQMQKYKSEQGNCKNKVDNSHN